MPMEASKGLTGAVKLPSSRRESAETAENAHHCSGVKCNAGRKEYRSVGCKIKTIFVGAMLPN